MHEMWDLWDEYFKERYGDPSEPVDLEETLRKCKERDEWLDSILSTSTDGRFSVSYIGTKEFIEECVKKHKEYLRQITRFEYCVWDFIEGYKYTVRLFLNGIRKFGVSGIGPTYEAARQQADEDFPFEATVPITEEVKVKMSFRFTPKYLEQLRRDRQRDKEAAAYNRIKLEESVF